MGASSLGDRRVTLRTVHPSVSLEIDRCVAPPVAYLPTNVNTALNAFAMFISIATVITNVVYVVNES